jgi:hypothetical protein
MNVVNSENHSTPFFHKFVVRLVQTAASDLKTITPPSAHDLAMAYQAAFATPKAAV